MELHGGSIRVESQLAQGSTFVVELPCPEPQNKPTPITRGRGKPRILVVDDNAVNRKMVSAVLEKNQFEVSLAKEGQEAIQALERDGADLVLMDIQMPVLDGLEATRLIRSRSEWSKLPVVAMTAHAMNGDPEVCEAAGMDGYITKPVHAVHLLETVRRILAESQAEGSKAAGAVADDGPGKLEVLAVGSDVAYRKAQHKPAV